MTMRTIILRSILALLALFVVFVGGFSYQDIRVGMREPASLRSTLASIPQRLMWSLRDAAHAEGAGDSSPLDLYVDSLETVRAAYYGKTPSVRDLSYSAIRGMMGSLGDRYTRFLAPDDFSKMEEDNQGQFVGIGAQLDQNPKGQVEIVKPLPGSPALRAHLQAGDVILKVNGHSVAGFDITRVISLIHGAPRTPVILTLARPGSPQPVVVTIVRDYVHQEVVVSRMIDPARKIGYIALAQFNEESDVQIGQAMTRLQQQGMRALVFDLRGNPGGLLNIAQDVASRFVAGGPVVWVKERGGSLQELAVEDKQHNHPRYPLAVLVNSGSASAAEITSGAIKDTNSGVLIGETTFGKGLVQTIIPLPDKSAVAITTAHYFTPLKNDINHRGIEPNIAVKLTKDDQVAMNKYSAKHPADPIDLQYDRQLKAAVTNLQQRLAAGARPEGWAS